jgi:hypothetical protein
MATVQRSDSSPKRVAPLPPATTGLSLPSTPSESSDNLSDYYIFIHGEKKIGKTSLAMVEEGSFLLTFDPIQKALRVLQRHVPDWRTFMEYLTLLEQQAKTGKYPYKRIVVDGADIWYRKCQEWVEKKLVVDHVSEEKWGRGWDMLKNGFANAVDRLFALPGGCWTISHSDWKEVETREKGTKINKLLPLMKSGGEEILVGRVDGWFAYDYVGEERVLIVEGDERTGAGHRIKGHFQTPKGRKIREIPMGESEEEAYANLLNAFHNKQTFITIKERNESAAKRMVEKGAKPEENGKKV